MNNKKVFKVINELQTKISRDNLNRYIKNHYPEIFSYICDKTKALDKFSIPNNKNKQISIFERLYCLQNNLIDRPKCKKCNKNYVNGFNITKNEYKKWCCPSCQASDNDCIEKSKNTRKIKYNDENYNGKLKAKQTRINNFGSYHSTDFGKKVKNTKLLHFGNENFINIDKIKQTKFEKYGDENYTNTKKIKQTKFEKYGDENYNNRKQFKETLSTFSNNKKSEIKEKRKQTNLKKYGVEFINQNSEIKEKRKQTNLKKYGVETPLNLEYVHEKIKKSKRLDSWNKIIQNDNYTEPYFSLDYFLNYSTDNDDIKLDWKCKKCGNIFKAKYYSSRKCPKCFPSIIQGTSKMEQEILNFLKTFYLNDIFWKNHENKKILNNGKEIDIYISEKKLAIEFDGLYWHSECEKSDKNYHLNKTLLCEKQGIQLIHIFENEWINKQDIVKSRLKNLLGIYDKTIYARKCEIKEVDSKLSKEFQDKNHIQGSINSKVNLGLYFNNELISLMTFSKCRFDKKHEWELLRFCNKLGYHIPGGASKLLKYFERNYNPKSLVSYADRRWSQGKVYEKLGFTFSHASAPNYWYWKDRYLLESRVKYQKHKLKNLLETFDENKTEVENMKCNGYHRIYDCGNLVYEKIY